MFNNFQRPPPKFRGASPPNGGVIDFTVNDIVFDKKTFEKEPIDWSTNDINFKTDSSMQKSVSVSTRSNNYQSRGYNQQRSANVSGGQFRPRQQNSSGGRTAASAVTMGGGTTITLQEVAKNLENLLYLRQTLEVDDQCYYSEDYSNGGMTTSVHYEQQTLYCDTTPYYTANTSMLTPPPPPPPLNHYNQELSPNHPLYVDQYTNTIYSPPSLENTVSYSQYEDNGTVYFTQQPPPVSPPILPPTQMTGYTPGGHRRPRGGFSRHNSVESNHSVTSSSSPKSSCATSDTTSGGQVKKLKARENDFDVCNDLELNSLVDLIISD
eukprot:TRINITY_DN7583_c0_g1_i4.p1 TRINITY_DN7583_c0_g1~~TRINITY_DN7583_c0_g1_i4.p1  ORF type:complete len:323 (-),score=60.57 TRINITY_DN7583_c0_g1_i4:183-1151(-)